MAFDKETPEDNLLISLIPTNFRYILDFLEDMNNKEHVALAGGISELTAGGEHKEGSARCYVEDDEAAIEALVPLDTFEEGRIALAEDTGRMYIHDGTDWIDILDSFLSVAQTFADDLTISGELGLTGNLTINTDKFVVTAETGAVAAAGKITSAETESEDADETVATKGYVDAFDAGFVPTIADGVGAATASVTLPNGLIFKWGKTGALSRAASKTVEFPTAFPNGILTGQFVIESASYPDDDQSHAIVSLAADEMVVATRLAAPDGFWLAIGY